MEYLAFAEGQLTFHFDPAYWQGRKYDDHAYFQGFSGVGLKGVDFIGIYQEDILVLLEVKNYTWRDTPFREKDVRQSLRGPEQIAAAVQQKMEDTLAGLRAIGIYYQRKQARSWGWLDLFDDLTFERTEEVAQYVMDAFDYGTYDKVVVAYSRFKNAAMQYAQAVQFLPVVKLEAEGEDNFLRADYIF
ncbi:MAG TPA: hypothetical protein VJ953_15460, partial [Saprospiraceae bacterium]|nr:hypothetical protein [Saprospiraceae bacterium]